MEQASRPVSYPRRHNVANCNLLVKGFSHGRGDILQRIKRSSGKNNVHHMVRLVFLWPYVLG